MPRRLKAYNNQRAERRRFSDGGTARSKKPQGERRKVACAFSSGTPDGPNSGRARLDSIRRPPFTSNGLARSIPKIRPSGSRNLKSGATVDRSGPGRMIPAPDRARRVRRQLHTDRASAQGHQTHPALLNQRQTRSRIKANQHPLVLALAMPPSSFARDAYPSPGHPGKPGHPMPAPTNQPKRRAARHRPKHSISGSRQDHSAGRPFDSFAHPFHLDWRISPAIAAR